MSRFEQNLEYNLEKLRNELKKRTYRPEPLRRVEIPKPNGKMRLLGIPCLCDKIVQEAIRMQLEPIYEVEFHNSSLGFRPNRNAHHAIFSCRQMLQNGYTWVIEGDVKACFDEISHKAILAAIREKVMDNKFLDLLRLFLKAGVVVDGRLLPTNEGVPQGGVVSPLLANAVLNKLDWFLHGKGKHNNNMHYAYQRGEPNVRFVRYADDWCVFITRGSKRFAEALREEIREFLATKSGLRLSEEKTHVTHVRDGFNFLGFHLRKGIGKNQKLVPKVKVGQKAKLNIQHRLNEAIRYRPAQESIASRMVRASAIIRGWSNYFKIAHNYSVVASELDHTTFWTMIKAICLKSDITTAQCIKKHKFQGSLGIAPELRLCKFSDTKMSRKSRGPEPYEPGSGGYHDDSEFEVEVHIHERNRQGSMDLKFKVLEHDQNRCRNCGCLVVAETSELDHIKPVKHFANFELASTLDNLQTLCLYCHKQKVRAEARKV